MTPFGEMLAVDSRGALQFFVSGLLDVLEREVNRDELLYNASVLAHYTQVSCEAVGGDDPCPRTLADIFDKNLFLEGSESGFRGEDNSFEVIACQTLLFSGFFRDQMCRRHNINWYHSIGAMYFRAMADRMPLCRKSEVMRRMSASFPFWAERQARLQRDLRDNQYLIRVDRNGRVQ